MLCYPSFPSSLRSLLTATTALSSIRTARRARGPGSPARFYLQWIPADAALAALDLSISHLQEGKTAKVRELADEMVIVFRDLEVSRERMAALLLFQEAARRETAIAELARQVAASLNRARR